MADDERVIITENKDGTGRRFSVTRAARDEFYPGFYTEGVETDAAFLTTGIPKPKRKRNRPRPKEAAPVAELVEEAAAEAVEETPPIETEAPEG